MTQTHISIGQVKRDISDLVNRVAYGGERIVLTSRGKPKAAIVSMEDYDRLRMADDTGILSHLGAWFEESDRLASRMLAKRAGKLFDADSWIAQAKADLEERHDFLRGA